MNSYFYVKYFYNPTLDCACIILFAASYTACYRRALISIILSHDSSYNC